MFENNEKISRFLVVYSGCVYSSGIPVLVQQPCTTTCTLITDFLSATFITARSASPPNCSVFIHSLDVRRPVFQCSGVTIIYIYVLHQCHRRRCTMRLRMAGSLRVQSVSGPRAGSGSHSSLLSLRPAAASPSQGRLCTAWPCSCCALFVLQCVGPGISLAGPYHVILPLIGEKCLPVSLLCSLVATSAFAAPSAADWCSGGIFWRQSQ
jgi:hypothetical protein